MWQFYVHNYVINILHWVVVHAFKSHFPIEIHATKCALVYTLDSSQYFDVHQQSGEAMADWLGL